MTPRRKVNIYEETEKEKPKAVRYVELSTEKNISIREEFLFLYDVKAAININALEERRNTKLRILAMLRKSSNLDATIQSLEESADLDRHRLIKMV